MGLIGVITAIFTGLVNLPSGLFTKFELNIGNTDNSNEINASGANSHIVNNVSNGSSELVLILAILAITFAVVGPGNLRNGRRDNN